MKSISNRVIWLFLMFSCFQIESVFAEPDVFTLTSATPGCNGSSPQITLNWTTSSGVVTYDLYRNGSLYVADLPANGRSFPDTGSKVTAGVSYTYFLRAKNADGTTDSGQLQATAPTNCSGTLPPDVFTLTNATPSCNGSIPQVTLNWTTSVGAINYDVYRNGSLFLSGIPPDGRTYVNTGANVTPGVSYTYFIRARNADGARDSGSLQ